MIAAALCAGWQLKVELDLAATGSAADPLLAGRILGAGFMSHRTPNTLCLNANRDWIGQNECGPIAHDMKRGLEQVLAAVVALQQLLAIVPNDPIDLNQEPSNQVCEIGVEGVANPSAQVEYLDLRLTK